MASRRRHTIIKLAATAALCFLSCAASGKPVEDKVIIKDFATSEFKYSRVGNLIGFPLGGRMGYESLAHTEDFSAFYDGLAAIKKASDLKLIDISAHYQNTYRALAISKDEFKKELLAALYGPFITFVSKSRAGDVIYAAAIVKNDAGLAFNSNGNFSEYKNPPKVVNYKMSDDKRSFAVELEFGAGWDFSFYRYFLLKNPENIAFGSEKSPTAGDAARILFEDPDLSYSGRVYKVTYAKKSDKNWEFARAEKIARTVQADRKQVVPPKYDDSIEKAMKDWAAEVAKSKAESSAVAASDKVSAAEKPAIPSGAVKATITVKETGEKVPVSVAASESIAADSEGSYGVINLFDGNLKTVWCPKGEHGSFTVYFDKPRTIKGIGVANGYQKKSAKGSDLFRLNARVDILGVMNDRGKGWSVKLSDDRDGTVRYNFESSMTDPASWENVWSLKFEIVTVYAGTSSKDVVLSELEF